MLQIAALENIFETLTNTTWDILVIFFFVSAGFFYGLSAGKTKLLSVLFSLYISILLFNKFPYLNIITEGRDVFQIFLIKTGLFLALIIILWILFSRSVFKGTRNTERVWQIFILSFLEVGLFTSAIFQLLPAKELFTFSPVVELLFASEKTFFWWLVLPLVSLLFIISKRKKRVRKINS